MRFRVHAKSMFVGLGFALALVASACSSSASDSLEASSLVPDASEAAEATGVAADPGIVEDLDAAYAEFSALLGSFGGATFSEEQAELLARVDCGRIASSSSAENFADGWEQFNARRIADGLDADVLRTLTVVAVITYCPQWNLPVTASFTPELLLSTSSAPEFGEQVRLAVEDGTLPERGREIVVDVFLGTDTYTDEQKAQFTEAVAG